MDFIVFFNMGAKFCTVSLNHHDWLKLDQFVKCPSEHVVFHLQVGSSLMPEDSSEESSAELGPEEIVSIKITICMSQIVTQFMPFGNMKSSVSNCTVPLASKPKTSLKQFQYCSTAS